MKSAYSLFWKKQIFLFDLDGTLYLGKRILPGARKLIRSLRTHNKKIFFFTNNSSRSIEEYVKKLNRWGFHAKENEIVMSTHILIHQLKRKRIRDIYLLGTKAMASMLQKAGIRPHAKKPKLVVVGFDRSLTYEKLERACFLVAQKTPYWVTHPDLFCPTDQGPQPDCGTIAKAIELTTKRLPQVVLGKPHPEMIREVFRRTQSQKKDLVLIGDRLQTDIKMGAVSGIDTILVLTGESKRSDLRPHGLKPSAVIQSVQDLLLSDGTLS